MRYAYASIVDAEGLACKRLGAYPDLDKTSVGETDADWERLERGWRYPGGTRFVYKVTYIRHLQNRGLSVTKLTKKINRLFVTKIREFSVTCI